VQVQGEKGGKVMVLERGALCAVEGRGGGVPIV